MLEYKSFHLARVTILKTGGLEKRELVFTETSVKSELKRRVHDVTEADTCSKPKEKNHGVTEASVNSKPENRTHGDTEAGVNSKPEGNVYGFQKAGINRESEEGVHGVIEAEFNSKPEERSHGNTETNVIEAGVNSEIEERVYGGTKAGVFETLDDYNTWKTNVSDQFSTLTDDEVSVLFCFLCSDSSPPDFTDKEWLDLLNVIRQIVYGKYNPVTSEEAQQTLDRLKSRDFLWEDKDKITKDTKDETMYRKASIDSFIPFFYSSYDTASVYLRSSGYNRKPGEKCVSSTAYCDDLLIRRLQMNILTHVIMEDTYIYDDIHQILNVKKSVQKDSIDEREKFVMDLRNEGEVVHRKGRSQDSVQHVTWLWRYGRPDIVRSCIGLHPHWDINIIDNKAYRKPSEYNNFSPEVRCLLYSLLLTEKYQLNLNEQSYRITRDKIRDRFFTFITDDGLVDLPDGITETHNGVISFISDDIRHDVMYAFVTECLVEDSDLEFFLATASRDVISEYCRSWKYERSEGERCLYIPDRPDKMYDLFIDKLQLDIITHCTVSDRGIHGSISKRLNIPEEILKWDTNARKRFAESLRHGRVEMFRARGMIVGCAGAGKTTLLRKLQRKHTKENQTTETTLGLEVHEDLFEIKDGTLYDFSVNDEDIPVARFLRHNTEEEKMVIKGILHHSSRGTKLISMTDFAGQVAYYACHQVYLSSRAFYIVVIDMSLGLDEEVRIYHTDRHNPEGSLFHSWKYKDYFHFWLQSIQTYCDVGKTHTSQESAESRGSFHPVIIVASHADKVKEDLQKMFYEELENCLSDEQSLKHLISPNRYLKIECPPNNLSSEQQDSVECLRKCIVKTVESMPQWGEVIPLKWANLEKVLNQMKENKKRVISVQYLKELKNVDLPCDKDLEDGLRFLHEIGQIVYFAEEKMKDVIIVDVQWFVDAFKYIITDEKHLAREGSKNILLTTGRITEYELKETWENSKNNYIKHIDVILPYMNKLGLMTKVQDDPNGHIYYIPSMNRTDFPKDTIKSREKTSIMVFRFKTYLPHFFFFRLVVNCLKEWEALEKKLYKNAAFYKVEDASHYIAIAVNKTSIQLQVFTPEGMHLQTQCVVQIRKTVASLLTEITQTFHRHIEYEIGYYCKDINITDEDEDFFISESDVMKVGTSSGKGQRPCPKHAIENVHQFDKQGILQFWV
ncbi:uncharacterized protein LOC133201424 [Saccostrea echinata]|uniref:uncharacterized protein LOC133201424 n=1 Tax=Saccostrea echinata TaxID=191078 RepID=UPI002A80023C|nr:uncharacterized protein LOC133201424 [Saccostrea echinata]